MEQEGIIKKIYDGILELDRERTLELANAVVSENLGITDIIQKGMSPAMDEVGKRFQMGTLYLPELQISAEIFAAVMQVFQPKLLKSGTAEKRKGRVIIGTVKGDQHSIGKNLVATMLKVGGFDVDDLGIDVPIFTFLEQAEKVKADIIALSALLTTTMPVQREIIEALKEEGIRDKFKVMVGGAPVNQKWADEIGADGYAENAPEAVRVAKALSA
jgi:corrinoid protein of di/trimethylamine methyltransferase